MYQQFYTHSTLLGLPLLAMALFMGTFAVVVGRALLRPRHEREAHLLELPLLDDEQPQGDRHGR